MKRWVALFLVMLIGACDRPPEVTELSVTVGFAGDVCFDWGVEDVLTAGIDPFGQVSNLLRASTIAVVNLETPITERGDKQIKLYTFRCPSDVLGYLTNAGFDVAVLGNNHAMDYGLTGLKDTLSNLMLYGLLTTGAGTNLAQAVEPVIIETNGFRIGVLAFGYMNAAHGYLEAENDQAGVAPLDTDIITNAVAQLAPAVDFLIVSMHWGKEYSDYPTDAQKEMGHAIIDSGADWVVGHHPHILQGIESYGGGVIFYSLGNFMFPQTDYVWKRTTVFPEVELVRTVSNLAFTNLTVKYTVTPLYRNMTNYAPELPTGETNRLIVEHLKDISSDLNDGELIFAVSFTNGWSNYALSFCSETE